VAVDSASRTASSMWPWSRRPPSSSARRPRTRNPWHTGYSVVLSPVLAHVKPPLGHLSPTVPYPELIARLNNYVAYTPINNITGTPAISLPMAQTPDGLPIGVHLSAAYGDERTLLETAFALEQQQDWPRIQH